MSQELAEVSAESMSWPVDVIGVGLKSVYATGAGVAAMVAVPHRPH
jgi:hypothetical protein